MLGYIYKSGQGHSKKILARWRKHSGEFKTEYTAKPSYEALKDEIGFRRRYSLFLAGIGGMVIVLIIYLCNLSLISSIVIVLSSAGASGLCHWLAIAVRGKHVLILLRDSEETYLIHNEVDAYRLADVEKVVLTTRRISRNAHKQYRNCAVSLITKSVLRDIHLGFSVYNVADLITLFDKANIDVDIKDG